MTFAAPCPSSSDELELDESDDEDEDEEDEEGKGLTRLFVVGSAIFVVVVSVSSSLESDDESDDELEETSLALPMPFSLYWKFRRRWWHIFSLSLKSRVWTRDHESRKKQARAISISTVNRTAYFRRRTPLSAGR